MKKGVFIAFEGIDGSGKGTQISLLMDKIIKKEFVVIKPANLLPVQQDP